jgi:hypothetical protein
MQATEKVMNFDEFEHLMSKIVEKEFSERNFEVRRQVVNIKGELSARGILNSSITLQKLSEFFEEEYLARCDFIAEFIINQIGKIDLNSCSDPVTDAKAKFQNLAFVERDNVKATYEESANTIEKSLLNSSFSTQIAETLSDSMERRIEKNNLKVELEYKSFVSATADKREILLFSPNLNGIGVNLKELWYRIFKA